MGTLIRLFLVLGFRVGFWTLITSNFEFSNILIGLLIACVIPLGSFKAVKIRSLLSSLIFAVKIVPNMLIETWQIIRIKHPKDAYMMVPMCTSCRRNGSRFAQFMQVIYITSTPMSIVVGHDEKEHWRVHTVRDNRSLT